MLTTTNTSTYTEKDYYTTCTQKDYYTTWIQKDYYTTCTENDYYTQVVITHLSLIKGTETLLPGSVILLFRMPGELEPETPKSPAWPNILYNALGSCLV
jgi:hypothetical protein